ncbi:MAG TPA: hypothetical protein VGV59_09995 [Pyrinomonadaceae bacterium]|nr:hypothetical protein [Pyrinomonadaceae bacterium]
MAQEVKSADELAQVFGQVKEDVIVGGKTLTITPFRTKQFVEVLKCIDKLADAGVVEITDDLGKAVKEFNPLKMVLRGGDQLIRILHIASGLMVGEIEQMELTETVKLASTVFSVNLDFFFQNGQEFRAALGPAWEALQGVIGQTTGQPPLTDSSPQATA